MRSPSARVLNQTCAIYRATRGQDTSGGASYSYGSSASASLACSAQPHEFEEVYENDRVTQVRHWRLMFTVDPGLLSRDKVVWTDRAGVTHTGFVQASRDEAGRGAAWTARVIEKL